MSILQEVQEIYENALKNPEILFEQKKQEIINRLKDSAIKSVTSIEYRLENCPIDVMNDLKEFFRKEGFKVEIIDSRTFGKYFSISF